MNHSNMIGPNHAATLAVPRLCTRNRPTMITTLSGRINGSNAGATSFSPSTADSTEIAGVMIRNVVETLHREQRLLLDEVFSDGVGAGEEFCQHDTVVKTPEEIRRDDLVQRVHVGLEKSARKALEQFIALGGGRGHDSKALKAMALPSVGDNTARSIGLPISFGRNPALFCKDYFGRGQTCRAVLCSDTHE